MLRTLSKTLFLMHRKCFAFSSALCSCAPKIQRILESITRPSRGYNLRRGRRPKWMLKIARERIDILFKLAEESFEAHPERSDRYVEMARNIATKYNMKMPGIWKRRFCKNCNKFLKPGNNCQIRLRNSRVTIKCLECGNAVNIPYITEKKDKRRKKIESYIIKKGINE